jgi:Tfp pilus assembly protein PilO
MNLKTLFFPLSVVICLAVAVWYIQPEISTVLQLRDEAAASQAKLDEVVQKVRNVGSLNQDLDAHADQEKMVLRYLPNAQDDERVVDTLNFLASQAGVSLGDVKLEKGAAPVADQSAETAGSASADVLFSQGQGDGSVPVAPKPSLKTVDATVKLQGGYENIKDFITKLYHVDRFQDVGSVKISQEKAGENENSSGNVLTAEMKVTFSYFPKGRVSADGTVFSQSNMNFSTADKLRQLISAAVPQLEVGSAGKSNPFVR